MKTYSRPDRRLPSRFPRWFNYCESPTDGNNEFALPCSSTTRGNAISPSFPKWSAILVVFFLVGVVSTESAGAPDLRISEFLASNRTGLTDADHETSDWIEIWNASAGAVSLDGWYLSDDPDEPRRWALPPANLAPGAFVLIFASGKDRRVPGSEWHTNFRLNRDGGFLGLYHTTTTGTVVVAKYAPYPAQRPDISYGWILGGDFAEQGFFLIPTPGAPNDGDSLQGFVADTRFSVDRGYYYAPVGVVVTSATPGASLIYTLDGSAPRLGEGHVIEAPDPATPPRLELTITTTTTLRVMAFKEGYEPSNVDTQTYLFPEAILQQNGMGEPFEQAAPWGHAGPDWEMDPDIVNHTLGEIRPEMEDFLRLPTVSLVMDFQEMFGPNGIYISGQGVERSTSVELINPEPNPDNPNAAAGFQSEGTVQIVGGTSPNRWKSDKLSLRLKFPDDLHYPLFGDGATERFDTLVLDARLNNVWHYGGGVEPDGQRGRAQYVRDQYAANLHNSMGGYSPHGRHVHLFLNGIYWGIHTLHERPDDNFAAAYLGGANEDYDSLKHNPGNVLQGSSDNYLQLHALADRALGDPANYQAVRDVLDIDNFISYMLVNYYVGNNDWAHHNWYASYNHIDPAGRWRFHSWDAEKGLHRVDDDLTGKNDSGGPTNLHHDLVGNAEYRLRFADLAYHHLRHGVLTPETAARLYRKLTDTIDLAMRLESARWGDNRKHPPFTRLDWVVTRDEILGAANPGGVLYDYFNRRSEIVLSQFRNRGWLPLLTPPAFNQEGGTVPDGFALEIQADSPGTIYFTLDGSDPRVPGRPGILTSTPLVIENSRKRAFMPADASLEIRWLDPAFDDSNWPSGTLGAGYENGSGYEPFLDPALDFHDRVRSDASESLYLRISFEVQDRSQFDRLQLGMRYDDGFVAYLNGVEIARANAPGPVDTPVPWNVNATAGHSDGLALGFESFNASTGLAHLREGENVLAVHGLNVNESSSDFLIWPVLEGIRADGGTPSGPSPSAREFTGPFVLESSGTVKARLKSGADWSPLAQAEYLVDAVPASTENLVVVRLHYHPAPADAAEVAAGFFRGRDFEFLELRNVGAEAVNLSGVRWTDGIDFVFDADASVDRLEAGESLYLVANEDAFALRYPGAGPVAGAFHNDTNLSNAGEHIRVVDARDQVLCDFTYDDDSPWPESADGHGYSLAVLDPESHPDLSNPANWTIHPEVGAVRNDPDIAFHAWLSGYFSAGELEIPALTGAQMDPDSDGLVNLVEFFHHTNPRIHTDLSPLLAVDKGSDFGESHGLGLHFAINQNLGGLSWRIAVSKDLVEWSAIPPAWPVSRKDSTPETDTVQISLPRELNARFFRLEIGDPTAPAPAEAPPSIP